MRLDISSLVPSWGSTGENPGNGFSWSQGDNPDAPHFNFLFYTLNRMAGRIEEFVNGFREDFDEHADETNAHNVSLEEARLVNAALNGDIEIDGVTYGNQFQINGSAILQENQGQGEGMHIDPQPMYDWDVETDHANVMVSNLLYPPRYETFEDLDENSEKYRGGVAYVADDTQMYFYGGGEWHPMGPTDA